MLVSSCGAGGKALGLLTGAGSGTSVAANIQAGKTNTQTIGLTHNISPTATIRPRARVDTLDQSNKTTNEYQLPSWVWIMSILLLVVGWATDTPKTMLQELTRKRDKKDG